jgi:hypothetical protein
VFDGAEYASNLVTTQYRRQRARLVDPHEIEYLVFPLQRVREEEAQSTYRDVDARGCLHPHVPQMQHVLPHIFFGGLLRRLAGPLQE